MKFDSLEFRRFSKGDSSDRNGYAVDIHLTRCKASSSFGNSIHAKRLRPP